MNDAQVIVVGPDNHGEWPKDTYIGFKEAGYNTEFVYTNTVLGGMNSQSSVASRAFLEKIKNFFRLYASGIFKLVKEVRRQMSERSLLKRMDSFRKPGAKLVVLFMWTPPRVSLLKKLKKKKDTVLVMWQGEPPVRDPSWNPSFPYFDHIFCVDEEWFELFDPEVQKRMTFLPLTSSTSKHFPLPKNELDPQFASEVAFVGYFRRERAETLSVLKDNDLKIYGYWWEPGFQEFPWLKGKYFGPVSNADANKIFNTTKIAIGSLPVITSYMNCITQRVFDVSLAGNFQLSGYSPAIPKIFGDSIPMFRTPEELKKLVDHYLPRPEERARLAAKAHAIAMKDHTYANRIKTLMDTLALKGWIQQK